MTLLELARLVREARKAQRAYFKPSTRSQATLEASKQAERVLDRAVAEILDPPTLFGKEDADGTL